ncbi:DUF6686 family protein [Persicitalea sp.]|uniref:DUF6686 family protein n=1 Tax=Persicitalea sp. TaxID=3100273 RepID=UPI003593A301
MDDTPIRPINLALTQNGQVALCRGCQQCISLEFGFILQLFSRRDFQVLERNLRDLDTAQCLRQCHCRTRIILNTSFPDLYFTFSEPEFIELSMLLTSALSKLQLIEATERHLN